MSELAIDSLPDDLLCLILCLLPPAERARCALVCQAWRVLLAEPSLWRELRVDTRGEARGIRLLQGAVARAAGQLRRLEVTGSSSLLYEPLLAIARATPSLRVLSNGAALEDALFVPQVSELLRSAPQLQILSAGVFASAEHLAPLLAREGVFARLRLHSLAVENFPNDALLLNAFTRQLAAHDGLSRLQLLETPLGDAQALGSVVAAAKEVHLASLELTRCGLRPPAGLLTLSTLLSPTSSLRELTIEQTPGVLDAAVSLLSLSSEAVASLCAALRGCNLVRLSLVNVGLWHTAATPSTAPGTHIVSALTAHRTLHHLVLDDNQCHNHAQRCAAGASLSALVATRGLRSLSVKNCSLRDFGCAPLVEALSSPTCSLQTLALSANGVLSRFVELRIAPALSRSSSLTVFEMQDENGNEFIELHEAMAALAEKQNEASSLD